MYKFCLKVTYFLTVIVILCWAETAQARPWYFPSFHSSKIVNPYLTCNQAQRHCPSKWEGQTVLWEGTVLSQQQYQGLHRLELRQGKHTIPVHFVRRARNLDSDRCGYRVAVRGEIARAHGKFDHLNGYSLILLSPPAQNSFGKWAADQPAELTTYIAWRISLHQPKLSRSRQLQIAETLVATARKQSINPLLFASLIQIESAWDPRATSPSGAQGLGQLMPTTARGLNVSDPYDPIQNLCGSGLMIGNLFREWSHLDNPRAAVLASYNAGPNCVRRLHGQVPHYPETTNYVYYIGFVNQFLQNQTAALGILSNS